MKNIQLLHCLRWQADGLVFSEEYDGYIWLKPSYNKEGKRTGITKCCDFDYECDRHKEIRINSEKQNKELN